MPCPVEDHFYNLYHQKVSLKRETNRTIKILLSGTIQERKNQLSAIKAISILKGKGYKVILDIIGYEQLVKDYTNKCRETIQQNGLMHEVKIRGFTEHVQEFYSHSDILLCCSKDESMPQTILQAMAAGVLVVSTEIAGIKELIKDNYTGILYSGTDEQSIAAALEKAMRLTPQQRMDILINAHKTVKMVADHQFISAELLNLYNEAFEIQKNHSIPKLLKDSYKND